MHVAMRAAACCLLLLAAPTLAIAHPHAFIEAQVTIRFDDDGLAGFEQRWRLDPMLTATLLDIVDKDHDQKLNKAELADLEDTSMGSLKDFHYFTFVLIDGQSFEVNWMEDFTAYMEDGCMIYEFFVPCHVKAAKNLRTVKVAVYDPTFFSFVALVGEGGGSGIDPSKDPQFANPSVQAQPGDFERFINSTGFEQADLKPSFSGAANNFGVQGSFGKAKDMAYYQGLIIPDAFTVTFGQQ